MPGRILTAVGSFPGSDGRPLEVVSVVTLRPADADALIEFGAPSLSVFDRHCRLIWRQVFDRAMADIGFQTLALPGGVKALYVVAISIFEPVDQILSHEVLLVARKGKLVPFGPTALGGSRFESTYVGRLPNGVFAIVTEANETPNFGPPLPELLKAYVYRYRPSRRARSAGTWLSSETLDLHGARALRLPGVPPHPSFPLCRFFFGGARDTCIPSPMVIAGSDTPSDGDAPT